MTGRDRRIALGSNLLSVERPARYWAGEWGSRRPRPGVRLRVCLLFPDLYDLGISYYGFQILYHLLNRRDGVVCERAYLPWVDMQDLMRARRVPLFSLETGTAVREFDVVGVTLQTELHYPGVVRALDLAGIPLRAQQRADSDPLILGGGPCAYHPEPVAPFFDALALGDGEELCGELAEALSAPDFQTAPRAEKWRRLGHIPGIYVPPLYSAEDPRGVEPTADAPHRIRARIVPELKTEYYPEIPLVPLVAGAHDRLTVEIARGCTQGCRFCQAGFTQRPVRERPVEDIIRQVESGLVATGYDEVGLLSLSASDYGRLGELLAEISALAKRRFVSVAFPSLRPATFTEEVARLAGCSHAGTVTFALEAGSQRLRDVINKALDEDQLRSAVDRAWRWGWRVVKLYLMVGLPGETEDDLESGSLLLERLARTTPRGCELHVSVAPFIPKPHTPFERKAFLPVRELDERRRILCGRLRGGRVQVEWHNPERSAVEALLARGDRRLAGVIGEVARTGYGFEAWGGQFRMQLWRDALDRHWPDWRDSFGAIPDDAHLPWDHLTRGISPKFLRDERKRAERGETLPDCREEECYECGLGRVCQTLPVKGDRSRRGSSLAVAIPLEGTGFGGRRRYRLTFAKLWRMRLVGHRDLMRAVTRALLRAGIPLAYTQGFHPRPRVSYGRALPLGVGATGLTLEFECTASLDPEQSLVRLRKVCPPGIKPWRLEPVEAQDNRNTDGRAVFRLRFRGERGAQANSVAAAKAGGAARTVFVEVDGEGLGGERLRDLLEGRHHALKGSEVRPLSVTRVL